MKLQERMMALPDTVADVVGIGATFVSFSMVGVCSTHTHTTFKSLVIPANYQEKLLHHLSNKKIFTLIIICEYLDN